jgi:hypothetical protein
MATPVFLTKSREGNGKEAKNPETTKVSDEEYREVYCISAVNW